MSIDMYSEKTIEATTLIKQVTGLDWFYALDTNSQETLERFIACMDKVKADILASLPSTALQAPVREVPGWLPIEAAPKDMASRLYLIGRYCVQGFTDAAGELMVQSEISPHWRKMRSKPTHWMPLPAAPVQEPKP